MKKTISTVICISLLISIICVPVSATSKNTEEANINDFINGVTYLAQTYDAGKEFEVTSEYISSESFSEDALSYFSESSVSENEITDTTELDFQTCRLVVKSDKYPEKFNSVEIVSGYKDYYIIQFENEQDTQVAYEEYKNTSYITDVDIDSPVYLRNEDVTLTSEEEPHEVPKCLESWGGYVSGTYDVKKYIEDNNLGTREIVVGVLDTGVEIENEFLKDRIKRTYYNTTQIGDWNSEECEYDDWHGNAVSSIIVDNTPSNVKIAVYKMFSSKNNTSSMVRAATAMLKAKQDGVDIISTSFGCYDDIDNFTYALDVMEEVYKSGILITAAVENGGDNTNNFPTFPDCSPYSFSISSSADNNTPYGGYYGDNVALCAPGIDLPMVATGNRYGYASGTSFSSPMVASVCAIYLTLFPDATPDEMKEKITSTASPFNVDGINYLYGTGVLNAIAACGLEQLPTVTFVTPEGKYHEKIVVELKAPTGCEIRYTLNDTDPAIYEYMVYEEPIVLTQSTSVYARVYKDGKYRSNLDYRDYRVTTMGTDDMFTIDESGMITSYTGTAVDLIIPDEINNIKVTSVDANVFDKNCDKNLLGVRFPDAVTTIPSNCFKANQTVLFVEGNGITTIEDYGLCSSNVVSLDFPNLETIGRYAFATTWALEGINFPKLKEIKINAFMRSSLRYAYLPELKQVHGYAFQMCWFLKDFYAPKLEALHGIRGSEGHQFQGCSVLNSLDLPFVEKINIEAFDCDNDFQCGLKLLELSKVKTIKSLPSSNDYEMTKKDVTVVLPSTLTECCSLTHPEKDTYTVYASATNKYVNNWATDNGATFIALDENTSLHQDVPSTFGDGDESITFGAYGFNRKYQWYGSYNNNNYAGEVIEGATDKNFKPNEYKQYPYYYCEMTSTDIDESGEVVKEFNIKSSVCQNQTYYIFAKEKTEIDFDGKYIFTSQAGSLNLANIVGVQETTSYFSVPSFVYRGTNYFGTGSLFYIYENGSVSESYTVIVENDINGDSVVDVLDAAYVEQATNNHRELTGNYYLAGDSNRDGVIDIVDYQAVVNRAIA